MIVCSKDPFSIAADKLDDSFPHLGSRDDLYSHYWGNVTWDDVHAALCPELQLPETVTEALQMEALHVAVQFSEGQ